MSFVLGEKTLELERMGESRKKVEQIQEGGAVALCVGQWMGGEAKQKNLRATALESRI